MHESYTVAKRVQPNQIAAGDAFEPCQFARGGLVFLALGGRT